ncbi:hypothetical protein CLUG_00778 [Clavispora lusitaniae ATCC 42720]|uniref:Uncharacterized protein n=1 Tax=Clavispora lusitaniae (strain ATCC 42720) TaxID=306902 RepID=C4XXV5_CLAL4|nr:uncharacterized protein CLUG_00778 [Clavispora lusitaniae ATCC 42720]EEQ36654.1 hypothetical protein CLUG_00778 [Clavispora lusitaniae ATCC 42720]
MRQLLMGLSFCPRNWITSCARKPPKIEATGANSVNACAEKRSKYSSLTIVGRISSDSHFSNSSLRRSSLSKFCSGSEGFSTSKRERINGNAGDNLLSCLLFNCLVNLEDVNNPDRGKNSSSMVTSSTFSSCLYSTFVIVLTSLIFRFTSRG